MQIRRFRGSGEPALVNALLLKCAFLFETRSAQSIRPAATPAASKGRTRDRTRPMPRKRQKVSPGRRPHGTHTGHSISLPFSHRRRLGSLSNMLAACSGLGTHMSHCGHARRKKMGGYRTRTHLGLRLRSVDRNQSAFRPNNLLGRFWCHGQSRRVYDGPIQRVTRHGTASFVYRLRRHRRLGLSACCQSDPRRGGTLPGMMLATGNRDNLPVPSPLASRAGPATRSTADNFMLFASLAIVARVAGVQSGRVLDAECSSAPGLPRRLLRRNSRPARGGLGREHRRPGHGGRGDAPGTVIIDPL
jgi:hypothetical protein